MEDRWLSVDDIAAYLGFGFFIQREWRRLGRIQNFYLLSQHFNLATRKVTVHCTFRTVTYLAVYAKYILTTTALRVGKGFLGIRNNESHPDERNRYQGSSDRGVAITPIKRAVSGPVATTTAATSTAR